MKTKIEILDETVQYYRTHPRGVDSDGECLYSGGCAIAIRLDNNVNMNALDDLQNNSVCSLLQTGHLVDSDFKEEFRGHNSDFWGDIQIFHDSDILWEKNKNGGYDLTRYGKYKLKELKKTYA